MSEIVNARPSLDQDPDLWTNRMPFPRGAAYLDILSVCGIGLGFVIFSFGATFKDHINPCASVLLTFTVKSSGASMTTIFFT
jgi:hypothetical protein